MCPGRPTQDEPAHLARSGQGGRWRMTSACSTSSMAVETAGRTAGSASSSRPVRHVLVAHTLQPETSTYCTWMRRRDGSVDAMTVNGQANNSDLATKRKRRDG